MNNIKVMVWLFPILFIFHDFEEIIMVQPWIRKNKSYLAEKFPRLSVKLLPHFENITTSSFALGVAEEFILISIITIVSFSKNSYGLWAGLFIPFTLHLIIHCIQGLVIKKYVPASITSIICLPICLCIIKNVAPILSGSTLLFFSVIGFVVMIINLLLVHKGMELFNTWLDRYEEF